MFPCTSQFMHSSHHSLVTSILLICHNCIFLTTQTPWRFPDCSLTLAEFPDISTFPEIPEKWQHPEHWRHNFRWNLNRRQTALKDIMVVNAGFLLGADAGDVEPTKFHLSRWFKVVVEWTVVTLHRNSAHCWYCVADPWLCPLWKIPDPPLGETRSHSSPVSAEQGSSVPDGLLHAYIRRLKPPKP